jgi:hypothetical protein
MFAKKDEAQGVAKIKEFATPECCGKPMKFQNACGTETYTKVVFMCAKCNRMKLLEF